MASVENESLHVSVLKDKVVEFLGRPDGVILDCTVGMGGHSEALLQTFPDIRIIGIDQDPKAIVVAEERLARFEERISIVHSNFSEIGEVLDGRGVDRVDGVLADLGVSSLQFDSGERGFSFRFDAPLDMRMDETSDMPTAAEMLAELDQEEIANLIYQFGEERFSRRIARRIVERRAGGTPVSTTKELAELVERAVPGGRGRDKIHPATKTFQALRIAVNGEIEILEKFLMSGVERLNPAGRIAIISFHSLEDRIVKQTFNRLSGKCECPPRLPVCVCGAEKKVKILTKRPISPGDEEIERNPRARSAKLRAAERLF